MQNTSCVIWIFSTLHHGQVGVRERQLSDNTTSTGGLQSCTQAAGTLGATEQEQAKENVLTSSSSDL